jgi:hypothetical protein
LILSDANQVILTIRFFFLASSANFGMAVGLNIFQYLQI